MSRYRVVMHTLTEETYEVEAQSEESARRLVGEGLGNLVEVDTTDVTDQPEEWVVTLLEEDGE